MDDADALSIQAEQKKLNTLYDAVTARFGLISNRGNELAFSDDNSYYLLSSLEVLDEDGNLQRKADMFTKRTIQPPPGCYPCGHRFRGPGRLYLRKGAGRHALHGPAHRQD